MPRVLIIADDLTGALDSAVTFALRGLATVVARRPADLAAALATAPDVVAVATASREIPAAAAIAAVEAVAAAWPGPPPILFKKIDSRLKGHVAEETQALAAAFARRRALVVPAIPEFGRVVVDGQLQGFGVTAPIAVAGRLHEAQLELEIPDTTSAADIDRALAAWTPSTLLVGARGLAAALARRLAGDQRPSVLPALHPPLLAAIGTRDPITLEQVALLRGHAMVRLAAPNGRVAGTAPEGAQTCLVQLTDGADAVTGDAAARTFAAEVAALAGAMQPRTLFACGGETADSVLRELGIGVLAVHGEVLPGLPVSTAAGAGRPLAVVTKSGGFGTPTTLLELLGAVSGDP